MDFYKREELENLLGGMGSNLNIHRSVVFFNPKKIFLGSNVRIDCFCLLSAGEEGIHIGDHVHVGAGSYLFGGGGKIVLNSFANISSRVSLFTSSDDFVEGYMTNPTVPSKYKKVLNGPVTLEKHALVGSGSIVLPNVKIDVGGVVGALSLVKKSVNSFEIVCGTPAKQVRNATRGTLLLKLEQEFLNDKNEKI